MPFQSVNPTTQEALATYEVHSPDEVERRLAAAASAFEEWRQTSYAHRAVRLRVLAKLLRKESDRLAALMTAEMGKPIGEAHAEVEKCAWGCEYYAEHGEAHLAPETVETDASRSFVSYQPLGPILGIMPWNFPLWQVLRFTAPATMAGNVVLIKHAENVTGCALAIEELMDEAGFEDGVFQSLVIEVDRVQAVIDDRRIAAVTLTGSTRAGKAVAAQAAGRIKKTVLELGGSDPYVVLEDADLEKTAEAIVTSRMLNNGQSCIAAKRVVAVDGVHDALVAKLVDGLGSAVMGDPSAPETTLGPLARADLRDNLARQVAESIEAGADCRLGGTAPDGPGCFYPATVLTDVRPGMPAYEEELFGPALSVIRARDEADALRIANDTAYGLGAAVFTEDLEKGERIATTELQAGSCFVNGFVKSDPRLPFGGIKESGFGRELSPFGIREFVNVKTVWIA